MAFNTPTFGIFLGIAFLFFLLTSDRWRWLVLLLLSWMFYASLQNIALLLALAFVTLITYLFGLWMERASEKQKGRVFWLGSSLNILVLLGFRYWGQFELGVNDLFAWLGWDSLFATPTVLLSIGVSFFIFQAVGYLADIYKGVIKPEKHLGIFALYLSFFPKILQGPLERPAEFIPQLRQPYQFDYHKARTGALLFAWGLFKKIVIADRLAILVNLVYTDVHAHPVGFLLMGVYGYAWQLYFDFSGYTDMARGVARLFNLELTENFNQPYLARSVPEFWQRWHISFSRWILGNIFAPLQIQWRRFRYFGTAAALLVTFLISGIWHGATWGFLIWGLLHGIYMMAFMFYAPVQRKLEKKMGIDKAGWVKAWQVFLTFHLVTLAWIFFRLEKLSDAVFVVTQIGRGLVEFLANLVADPLILLQLPVDFWDTLLAALNLDDVLILAMVIPVYLLVSTWGRKWAFYSQPTWFRWLVYGILLATLVFLAVQNPAPVFIYYQF